MMNDDDNFQELGTISTQCLAAFTCACMSRGGWEYVTSVLWQCTLRNSLSEHFVRLFNIHLVRGNSQSCLGRRNDLSEIDVKINYAASELSGDWEQSLKPQTQAGCLRANIRKRLDASLYVRHEIQPRRGRRRRRRYSTTHSEPRTRCRWEHVGLLVVQGTEMRFLGV